MAKVAATCIRIESDGKKTPEYMALLHTSQDTSLAIQAECDDITRELHGAGVIPSRKIQHDDVMDKVLCEVAREPLIFYAFQHVLDNRNVSDQYTNVLNRLARHFVGKSYVKLYRCNMYEQTLQCRGNEELHILPSK